MVDVSSYSACLSIFLNLSIISPTKGLRFHSFHCQILEEIPPPAMLPFKNTVPHVSPPPAPGRPFNEGRQWNPGWGAISQRKKRPPYNTEGRIDISLKIARQRTQQKGGKAPFLFGREGNPIKGVTAGAQRRGGLWNRTKLCGFSISGNKILFYFFKRCRKGWSVGGAGICHSPSFLRVSSSSFPKGIRHQRPLYVVTRRPRIVRLQNWLL